MQTDKTVDELHNLVFNLTEKMQILVDTLDKEGELEGHSFTFLDGDVWFANISVEKNISKYGYPSQEVEDTLFKRSLDR